MSRAIYFGITVAAAVVAGDFAICEAVETRSAVAKLLATAGKSTPQAIAATREQYAALVESQGDSSRLRIVYALVLIEQHRYSEASAALPEVKDAAAEAIFAQRLKVWACLLGKKYPETIKAMEALGAIVRPAAQQRGEDVENEAQRVAFFLGQVIGFLEGPRAGAVEAERVALARQTIVERIGADREGSFEEGRADVRLRFEQWTQELNELKSEKAASLGQQSQQAQSALRAKQTELAGNEAKQAAKGKRLQADSEELAKIDGELKSARDAYDIVQARITVVRAQISNLRGSSSGVARSVASSEIRELNGRLAQLNGQVSDLNAKVQALVNRREKLATSGKSESQQMAQRDAEMRKQKKLIHHTEKQLSQAKTPQSSPEIRTLSAQITNFVSYEEFPFERNAQIVLNWFK
jgi:hypothetical protein